MSAADPRVRAVLKLAPVIPVYTPDDVDEAVNVAQALFRGGLPVIEVTLRTPRALDAIRAMVEAVPDAVIGAGTVLTSAQMQAAKQAGARFAVSPGATPALYAAARDADLPYLPGAATASDLMRLVADHPGAAADPRLGRHRAPGPRSVGPGQLNPALGSSKV